MTKKLTNPLDELFQTAEEAPVVEYQQVTEGDLATFEATVPAEEADEDDKEIDRKIDAIHDAALETFQQQMQYAEMVEPRYAARNAEVAASYLNIALSAAGMRAKVKGDRKRLGQVPALATRKPGGAVVASREDILRMIAIDAETKELK